MSFKAGLWLGQDDSPAGEDQGGPVSRYLAELAQREVGGGWPRGRCMSRRATEVRYQ